MKTPYEEGANAAALQHSFTDRCPYTFTEAIAAGVSIDEFNKTWRPKMDEWFRGWKETLNAAGLGYDFKPKKSR